MRLPCFDTVAGNLITLPTVTGGDERFYVQNCAPDEAVKYADKLVDSGYNIYSKRFISGGAQTPNIAYILEGKCDNVCVFFDSSLHTCFVSAVPSALLPPPEPAGTDTAYEVEMSITQLALVRGGMSYVVRFRDGSFLVVDGGLSDPHDEENLYKFLVEGSSGKPRIALWLITHPHKDHIELPISFIKHHCDDILLDAVAHQFPNCDNSVIPHDIGECMELSRLFLETVREYFPRAKEYFIRTSFRFYFNGAYLEVLYSIDNSFPQLFFSCNDISVVSRLVFDTGRSFMLLADAQKHICRTLSRTYGAYLKSDILQVAHHGLFGGDIELYKAIDPDICLWPVKDERFRGTLAGQTYQLCIGEGGLDFNSWLRDPCIKKREHYSQFQNITLKL